MKFLVKVNEILTSNKATPYTLNGNNGVSYKIGLTDITGEQSGEVKCTEDVSVRVNSGELKRFAEYEFVFDVDTDKGARVVDVKAGADKK